MSRMCLKTGDLDLALKGQIETNILCNSLWMQQLLNNFSFKLELCIDDLKDSDYFKNWWPWPWPSKSHGPLNLQNISFKLSKLTLFGFYKLLVCDLDLDLQICHQSLNVCVILWEHDKFWTILSWPFKLELFWSSNSYMPQMHLKLVPLTLTIKTKLAFTLQQIWKNWTAFSFNLQTWTVNWSSTGSKHRYGLGEEGGHLFFANAKKALTSYILNLVPTCQKHLSSDENLSDHSWPLLTIFCDC